MAGSVPNPSAAAPPAKNVRRAGLVGKLDGLQHKQLRKNLRRVDLALIPSSHSLLCMAPPGQAGTTTIAVVRGWFQAGSGFAPR